jgi:putative CocE/NonD family hydrolase
MVKKLCLLTCLLTLSGYGQELPFSKLQRKDSISLSKSLPELAQKVIVVYKDANIENYKDNLFRMQLVARNYKAVGPLLNELAQATTGDSTKLRALGISFRLYASVMAQHPKTNKEVESLFEQHFGKLYPTLDAENKGMVDQYYERELPMLKDDFEAKIAALGTAEKISVTDAVALCRSYCSYKTFSATLKKAKALLKVITDAQYNVDDTVVLTMKDGGTVSLTIARLKSATQPLPVVLMYNIYAGRDESACKEAAQKGYVGIIANTRGKRLSKDDIEPFEHDARDAYEIIDWISKQPWCNGKVGMYGGSYLGFSQWSAAKYLHPALKTIVPQVAVGAGIDFPKHNGIYMNYMLRWIHFVSNNKQSDLVDFNNNAHWDAVFKEAYMKGTPFNQLDSLEGRPNPIFQRWLAHPTYDSYWKSMVPQKEEYAGINIPILTTTGYYDDDQVGALSYYNAYQKYNPQNNYYLLIGPYDHGGSQGYPLPTLNDYKIDEVANIPIQDIVFQWFDYTLKAGPKPEVLKDKVNYELMGANKWLSAPSLSQMSNGALTFYLSSAKKLSLTPDASEGFIPQQVDFKKRDDYRQSKDTDYCGFPAFMPKSLDLGPNLLLYESDPLTEPIAITGTIKAYLDLAINKKDLDIKFQLYEKTPDGSYFALSSNYHRASLAKDPSTRQLLTPNQKEHLSLEQNFMACKQLQKGSRIVIALGVNKSADWQINYGTGKDVSEESIKDAAEPLDIRWFTSSSFVLPISK